MSQQIGQKQCSEDIQEDQEGQIFTFNKHHQTKKSGIRMREGSIGGDQMLNEDTIGKNFQQMVSQRMRIDGNNQLVSSVSTPIMNCQEKKPEKPKNILKINI